MNSRNFALILTLMVSMVKMNPAFGVEKEKKTNDCNSKKMETDYIGVVKKIIS